MALYLALKNVSDNSKQVDDENFKTLTELMSAFKERSENSYDSILSSQAQVSMALHVNLQNFLSSQAKPQNQSTSAISTVGAECPPLDFYTVAKKIVTDKVTDHLYHLMYQKYFPQVRCNPIRFLEIGLGCGMTYGTGASFYLWLEYFPKAEIYFIEYNEKCAKSWENIDPRVKLFSGDQANTTFLNEFLQQSGGNFDFIVDDGGHNMIQQITSLEVLLSSVKPGGMYFVEDLQTSFHEGYGGGENATYTTFNYLKKIEQDLITRQQNLAP